MSKKYMDENQKFYIWMNAELKTEMEVKFSQEHLDSYFKQRLTDDEFVKMKKFKFWILKGNKALCIAMPDKEEQQKSVKDFGSVSELQAEFSSLIKTIKAKYFSADNLQNSISDLVVYDEVFEKFKRHIINSIKNGVDFDKDLIDNLVDHQLPLAGLLNMLG